MSAPFQPATAEFDAPDASVELGRYHLVQRLASGGMASVYLARAAGPAGFEKVVALKRIHPHLANEQTFVEMFLDEARIASRIDHANVCSVFDFGKADGAYFIAMEFLSGEPLSHLINLMERSAEELADPRRAYLMARMVADACEGLHAAHELHDREGELLNVVHRDVSPQNLFLTYDGVVKVVDFGIASAAGRLHHTPGGEMKGKFAYLAPEQARGAAGALLDRRVDVFALGVVLWELLTLKRLFRRDTPAATLDALMNEPIPTPSSQRDGLTTDLDAIVMKALARDRDDRYGNARDLGRELAKAIGKAGEVIGAVDLADWLERLVPDAHENSRRRVESAMRGDHARYPLQPTGELGDSDVVVLEQSSVLDLPAGPPVDGEDAVTRAWSPLSPTPSHAEPRAASASAAARPSPSARAPRSRPPVPPPAPRAPTAPPAPATDGRGAAAKARYALGAVVLLIGSVALLAALGWGRADDAAPTVRPAHTPAPTAHAPVIPVTPAIPTVAHTPTQARPQDPSPPVVTVAPTSPAQLPAAGARSGSPRAPGAAPTSAPGGTGEAAAPPPPAADGALIVATPGGWAAVYDDVGRLLGHTPLVTRLPAGDHTLSLRPFGEPPAVSVSIRILEGDTVRVSHPLQE